MSTLCMSQCDPPPPPLKNPGYAHDLRWVLILGWVLTSINMVVSVTFLMVNLNNFIDSTNTFFRNIWKNSPHKLNSFCKTDSHLQLEYQQQKRQDLFPSRINSTGRDNAIFSGESTFAQKYRISHRLRSPRMVKLHVLH